MPPAPAYVRHESSLAHDTGEHPEGAARILAIERALAERDWLGFQRHEAPAAPVELLTAVHDPEYVAGIAALCARGGGMLDADTLAAPGSYDAARHAAGGAVRLVDLLLDGGVPGGLSALRPPGHHALPAHAMGFCLFNNVAIAARHARDAHGLDRVLIVDWDVHHGNGTNDVFHAQREVLFASIHQSPLYPGTGAANDQGSGPGAGYTVNLPVLPGAGDPVWCSLIEHVVVPIATAYRPQLVLVSAGYDAHVADPLAGCAVTEAGYAAMTGSLRRLCARLGAPLGLVLEGGYELGALARSVVATLEVLGAAEPPRARRIEIDDASRAAAADLSSSWPGLNAGLDG